ncbi:fibrous sheath CABYR-binding protein [Culex quinquefasciatus]|uniref:fibrous sheath CABYR-binding protein n=1 Tax=Culex quinquefasciatus TaxID=7176 RepID=UPI0018E3866D|nr:fibrous sheath CABYR-binding protein [Culex quinquefasciatus]
MNVKNKTCLFCLKQRQILVDDSCTAKAIQKIYSITLPTDECRICIECHFNVGRIREFKQSIDRCSDFDVDSCFVCKSENTVSEPGVDRVVDYLLKQCTTIDIGNTDTVRACTTCLYLLEISIKYEKLARNYANGQRFCKHFATIRDCNVALGKIDLDSLGDICATFEGNRGRGKKGKKRGRGSWGGREENASKRSKKEDGSVMPVMLTKLTPTMTPAGRPGKKSLSPDASSSKKGGKGKPNSKIFIKLPGPRKQRWKKNRTNRITYEAPHSPSISIPSDPSMNELNRIFNVELRPLSVRIEHVDLSSYLNRTISHDKTSRHPRKPKKEEFIGLDEEDVVELQQNNTSICSVGKRKSILVTDRIESPNSAKKKVKFSDSPSIKYVEKVNFSDDDDDDSEDADYEGSKPAKKKSPKAQNGGATPENGKPRRGRPKKVKDFTAEEEKKDEDGLPMKEGNTDSSEKKDDVTDACSTNAEVVQNDEKDDEPRTSDGEKSEEQPEKDKEEAVLENGSANEAEKLDLSDTLQSVEAAISSLDADICETGTEDAPMDTTEEQAPPMAIDEAPKEDEIQPAETDDAEMKATPEPEKSPEDVEMAESRTPPEVALEDVDMKEESPTEVVTNHTEPHSEPEIAREDIPQEAATTEFEASDKEDEIEQVKQCLNNILGEQISDSEPSQTDEQSNQEKEKVESVPNEKHEPPEVETEPEAEQPQELTAKADPETEPESSQVEKSPPPPPLPPPETPERKDQTFSSLDDVDDISDDDGILDQLDQDGEEDGRHNRKRSPDLPPLGEDSL